MAKDKAKVGAPANPRDLEWPRDVFGVATDLKKAITAAAGKVNGQPDKLAVILKVLEIGFEHTQARYASQRDEQDKARVWRAEQEAAADLLSQPKGYRNR